MPDEIIETPVAPEITRDEPIAPKKKRTTKTKKRRPPVAPRRRASPPLSSSKIDQYLNTIYEDDAGKIPDMKSISISPHHSILNTIVKIIFGGAALAALAWLGFWYLPNAKTTPRNSAELTIEGPTETALGATITQTIHYQNNNSTPLSNVILNVNYPNGFVVQHVSLPANNPKKSEWSLGTLSPHAAGVLTITGQLVSVPLEKESWRVFLKFQPANFNSELQTVATAPITVTSSPFKLSLAGPKQTALGTNTTYTLTVDGNNTSWLPVALQISPLFPTNFTLTSSSPALGKNNTWLFAIPTSTTSSIHSVIKIIGKFSDTDDASSTLKARLGIVTQSQTEPIWTGETSLTTALLKNDLSLNVATNGTLTDLDITPGDLLNTTIRLSNNSTREISRAVLTLNIEAPSVKKQSMIDWPDIVDPANGDVFGQQLGDFMRRGTIAWNSKKIPGLAHLKPGQEIIIDVRLPLKDAKKIDLSSFQTSTIKASGLVTFTDATGAAQTLTTVPVTITINSDLNFDNHPQTSIVKGKKQFDLTWALSNSMHPLKNIDLSATLFGDVTVSVASSSLTAATVSFDPTEQKLSWHIPEFPTSLDVATLPFTVTLNKNNPTQNTLISKVHITANDTVTGKRLDFLGDEIPLTTE